MTSPGAIASPTIQIRLLGDFVVSVDGAPIGRGQWRHLRAAQLLQCLALAPALRRRRDEVIDLLWPELGPDAGAANLRKAAHLLRQVLGVADAVVLAGGDVRLAPGGQVDVDLHRATRAAEAALATGDPASCRAAAALFTGPVLPDAIDAAWADAARLHTRQTFLALLRAAHDWERLATEEPTDEGAHRVLMQRALDTGNPAAALRWYARLESALRHTLGLRPSAEARQLRDACVGIDRDTPALVGRAQELATAERWLQADPAARAGGLLLSGAAGMGKTSLGRVLGIAASRLGHRVVSVAAHESAPPYAVVTAVVERVLLEQRAVVEALGPAARTTLAQVTPLAGPADAPQGPLGRHQVFGAVRRLLLAAGNGSPVLLHVDDAHLLGPADTDLLLDLAVTGRPVFVLLAARPLTDAEPLAARLGRLVQGGHLQSIPVRPLSDSDVATLATASNPALDTAQTARVARLAQGNPFVALELAHAGAPPEGTPLPEATRDALLGRLADVDGAGRRLLERIAVADEALDAALVVALGDDGDATTLRALDAMLRAGVLSVEGRTYRIRHDLVREALLARMPPHQRLEAHRTVAQALAAANAPPALVAHHWLEAGRPDAAQVPLLDAGRAAMRLGAFAEAVRHADLVLQRVPGHAEALRLRAEALDGQGAPAAVAAYHAAAAVAAAEEADNLRARGALAQIKLGDPAGALEVLSTLQPTSPDGRLAEALAYCGAAAMGVAPPERGTVRAAAARRLALDTGDTASIVIASWAQAAVAHARGELPGSLWADLYDTRHVPHLAVRVFDGQLCITQRLLYGSRPYADVIAFASALAAESARLGAARGHAFGTTLRGEAHLLSGNLDAAELDLREGARLHRAIGGATGESFSLQRLSEVAMYRGERSRARDLLAEALDVARQTDIGFHLLDRIYGTRIALGDSVDEQRAALLDAEEKVRGPLETCPGCRITLEVPAAIAAAQAGDLDRAEAHAATAAYLADVVMQLPAWHAALEEVRGHLSRARGATREAVAHFARAAAGFAKAGQPLDAGRCERLSLE